jgi:hypothetical protein
LNPCSVLSSRNYDPGGSFRILIFYPSRIRIRNTANAHYVLHFKVLISAFYVSKFCYRYLPVVNPFFDLVSESGSKKVKKIPYKESNVPNP